MRYILMTIKLEVTEERTQRDLSEEEWSFPIWRWAAFSLFDTLILVSPLTRELIYPRGSDSRFYLGKSLGNLMLDDTQRFIFIIIILTLLLPAFALIVESLLFSIRISSTFNDMQLFNFCQCDSLICLQSQYCPRFLEHYYLQLYALLTLQHSELPKKN